MCQASRVYGLACLIMFGCSAASAAVEPSPWVAADGVGQVPAARAACELLLSTKLVPKGRLQYSVQVSAENVAGYALGFVLPDRCPAGPLEFDGLPDGYDYYQTCKAGACLGPRGMQTIQLAARERRVLATFSLSVAGGSCNQALEPALYRLQPVAPPVSYRVCVEAARLDLRNLKIPAKPAKTEPKQPVVEAPSDQPSSDPYACTRSDECTISCPAVQGCCGWSCGCRNAIRRDQIANFTKQYARTCARAPHCPAVGCAYEPASSAVCRDGRCTTERGVAF